MKALVTGSTGFIGSHLVEALLARGYSVRVMLRPSSSTRNLENLDVEPVRASFDDPSALDEAVRGVDYVYHCAGVVAARNRDGFYRGNLASTEALHDAVMRTNPGIRRFVHVSSQAAVGPSPSPDQVVDEQTPLNPITTYGKSKADAERLVIGRMDRVPATIVRPPAVYGPRDVGVYTFFQTVKYGITPLIGFKQKLLSLIHVHDLVEGFVLAGESDVAEGETYFITSDEPYTWEEIGQITAQEFGRKRALYVRVPHPLVYAIAGVSQVVGRFQKQPPILNFEKGRDITQNYWICSPEKARRELGFRPSVDILTGVRGTLEWYREHGWL